MRSKNRTILQIDATLRKGDADIQELKKLRKKLYNLSNYKLNSDEYLDKYELLLIVRELLED